ncbi:hypothetical protein MCAG_03304 [Micromonospora sp. ATCC 39149]|nr:hypothetical protein MCAG_03304 [Micromonospora sp. ATCC 39149]
MQMYQEMRCDGGRRDGREPGGGVLVAACPTLAYNIVGRSMGGYADADDVVQETRLPAVHG